MINNDSLILGHATVKKTNNVFAITNIFIISKPKKDAETECERQSSIGNAKMKIFLSKID